MYHKLYIFNEDPDLAEHFFSLFRNEFNDTIIQEHEREILFSSDSKLLKQCIFGVKISKSFTQRYNESHYVMLLNL